MIITVTMNPAIDKTVDLASFEHGSLNRLTNVIMDAGGKGINVSKTIKELGGESIATGFIGGSAGTFIEKALTELGIKSDFISVTGETRTNLKVVEKSGAVTELNEPGPIIGQEEIAALTEKLEGYANPDTLFVFAGSIPNGVDKTIYSTLIEKVKAKDAKVFLDADGELFANSLKSKPDIIKPNRSEVEAYFGMDYRANEEELVSMGQNFLDMGIGMVAISLGQMGALFLTKEKSIRCPGLKVDAHSTVGAGDAMVAALSYGTDKGMEVTECIRLGVATSAGAVTTKGTKPPSKELVEELAKKVEIINL
ncbi:1-phosphofructokinase [Konateibacter massiliensis]|uniref:1-phosphofructokinase n=1 Tax=Konateibacter massiliensis TaxID=2002841 RepID=UPI000C15D00E|nr:1-phosphofructokinase [Konateibacter massiliensis]